MNDIQPGISSDSPTVPSHWVTLLSTIRNHLFDAATYWERMRVVYNGVLAILVLACWGHDIVSSGPPQRFGAALVLLIFAAIANALYCLAYPVDLAFQMTSFVKKKTGFRWLLFATGVIVASVLALWIMLGSGMG